MLDTTLSVCLIQQITENQRLVALLEQAYISDNFGCYNRRGGEIKGNEFLFKERRKVASGELVMLCCDIAGMGNLNTKIGELAVNVAVKNSLETIRSWRGVQFISQLNSGDEFIFIIDKGDIEIIDRMDIIFKECGFDGVYTATSPVTTDFIGSANILMGEIYQIKRQKKEKA